MILDYILDPICQRTFFDNYWEKEFLYINRSAPEHYNSLLTIQALDSALCGHAIRTEDCRFSRESRVLMGDVASFSNNRALAGIIDARKARNLFSEGWTIVFERAHRWHAALNSLCADLFEHLSHHTQCNIYLSPPNSYGFGPHFDTHDVFALQIHGRKKWKIYSNYIDLPTPEQATHLPSPPDESSTVELVLEPGDALYLPRGLVHDADSLDEASTHITLGILSYTWSDLFSSLVRRVTASNVDFRRSLPPGFLEGKGIPNLRDKILELAAAFTSNLRDSDILDKFSKNEFSERGNAKHTTGIITDIILYHEINITSTIILSDVCCPFKIQEVDKDTLALESCKKRVLFPARIRESIDYLLSHREVVVSEIPALDDQSKIVLGKRLVQEDMMSVQKV